VFVGTASNVSVRPHPEEVAEWAWVEPSSLRADMAETPHRYTVWFRRLLQPVLAEVSSPAAVEKGPPDLSS
jgi:isopentenyl-diphosphate delta-isomerase